MDIKTENWAFIRLMTICYAVAGLVIMIGVRFAFRNRFADKEKKDFHSLVYLLVPFITFCLWLLWICMYMAQMNPMIVPIKHIHEHVAHVEHVEKATA